MNRQNDVGGAVADIETAASSSKTRKVGDAYRHYCDQIDAGEQLDPDDYCAQFPSFQSSLGRLLKAHDYLEAHPELLEDETETPWPSVGESFLDFQLVHELGQGAFARVFLAKQIALGDRLVVVKISRQGGAAEAKTLGRIQHPNVVPIHSVHADPASGQTLVCMPYLGTATLHDVFDLLNTTNVRNAGASIFQVASRESEVGVPPVGTRHAEPITNYVDALRGLAMKLAEALAHIHKQGICHLDLKPSNVLLSPSGAPLLLDFNLSSDAHWDRLVQGGTLPYMSPEQLRCFLGEGEKQAVGPSSDLFSFGVLLYELATGVHPFGPVALKEPNRSLAQHLLERQSRGFQPVRTRNPDVDAGLAGLIESCLNVEPGHRPGSAADVVTFLTRQDKPVAQARRWLTRNPLKAGILSILGGSFLAAACAMFVIAPPESERQFAAAKREYSAGNFAQAIKRLNIGIDREPQNAAAYFARGRAFQKLGVEDNNKYSLAIQDFEQSHKLAPDGKNLAAAGYCFQCFKDAKTSAALLNYLAAKDAGFVNSELLNNIAMCYEKTGVNKAESRKYLDCALAHHPVCNVAYYNRALASLTLARNHQEILKVAAKDPRIKTPKDVETMKKELDEAIQSGRADFDAALKNLPPNAELLFHTARFQAMLSMSEPASRQIAIDLLRTAITDHNYALNVDDFAFSKLDQDPGFGALQQLPRPTGRATMAVRFADPLSDDAR